MERKKEKEVKAIYCRPKDASKMLNCSLPTIHRMLERGDISHYKVGKCVFIKIADLLAMVENGKREGSITMLTR